MLNVEEGLAVQPYVSSPECLYTGTVLYIIVIKP